MLILINLKVSAENALTKLNVWDVSCYTGLINFTVWCYIFFTILLNGILIRKSCL